MLLQRLTNYLLKNRWQALAITFVSAFLPVVGIVAILIAALMTLVKGIAEGAIFMMAATLPYLLAFFATGGHDVEVPIAAWAAIGVAVSSNILTWAFATMLSQRASWSNILQIAALAGVLVVCLIHFAFPDVVSWWGETLQHYSKHAEAVAKVTKTSAVQLTETQLQAINESKWFATGLMISAVLFNAILQLIVARWWQAAVLKPGSLRRELRAIRLSRLAAALFVASIVFWYIGNTVIYDILPIVFMLFAAAGLSLVHYFFGMIDSPTAWFWLLLFYVIVVFAMPVSVMTVAALGLLDVWFDFRKRMVKI